jgi:predicted kinase
VPTLTLLCGLAFSGKSTLARRLVAATAVRCVSLDEIIASRGLPSGGEGLPAAEWIAAHRVACERVAAFAAGGHGILVDDTNCYRWLRDSLRAVVAPYGYETLVVFLDVGPAAVRARVEANRSTAERPGIRTEVLEALIASFEPPAPDERCVRLGTPDEIDGWLRATLPA